VKGSDPVRGTPFASVAAMSGARLDDPAPIDVAVTAPDEPARRASLGTLSRSPTGKAVGLAAATMGANAIAVVFTVVFTRLLGADDYGSLAAMLNLSVILFVPGSALQLVVAREGTLGRLGQGRELAATLSRWTRHLLAAAVLVAAASLLLREPLAAILNVDQTIAAAAVPVTGTVWLLLSVQRGLLQSAQAYRTIGLSVVLEAAGRLLVALMFVAAGLGVTAIALELVLGRRLGAAAVGAPPHRLRVLIRRTALPISVLTLVAALQNVDVIMAKHTLAEGTAGVYAATTVAAKALVWIAIGLGMWVLPEATRRAAEGRDPRTVLLRAVGVIGALAACALLIFATVPELLLRTAFGAEYESGAEILLLLGGAYSLLAVAYIAAQFLLALGRRAFALGLLVIAIAEPLLLLTASDVMEFARIVLLVEAAAALLLLGVAVRVRSLPATHTPADPAG
jgi:O-antigen/teichoic acid export membrane protein